MSDLLPVLIAQIRASGPMSVGTYMAACMSDTALSYYRHRDAIGSEGDFITAPEISQMFGELVGLWCADTWMQMDRPRAVSLVELGPGRGTLMADALRAVDGVAPDFLAALSVHLVDINPVLRDAQRARLADSFPHITVSWHETLATVPPGPLLVIANEFFDTLPVCQYEATVGGWQERRVGLDGGDGLAFTLVPGAPDEAIPAADCPGAVIEECPAATAIVSDIARRLARSGGAALIIDYGGRGPLTGDTVQAVWHHRRVGVLEHPGEADLSHHVDFQALSAAASRAGVRCHGPVPQGLFLGRLGIEARAARLKETAGPIELQAIDAALRRLIHPASMGGIFKAFVIAAPSLPTPAGFTAMTRARSIPSSSTNDPTATRDHSHG